MNRKQFQKFLNRDKHCLHCGSIGEDLIPNHRANRGMGGSKLRERPSNVIVFCSLMNGLIESDAQMAIDARWHGWKIESWEDPLAAPVFDQWSGKWYRLDDLYGRVEIKKDPQG